jgi:hypothetical protein
MDILRSLAKMQENEEENLIGQTADNKKEKEILAKENKIEIVKKNLERMFELKMNFA